MRLSAIHAVVLGIVQGLTEFFPISSSGHLVLVSKLLDIRDNSLAFDTVLHIGTLAAVVIAFAPQVVALLRHPTSRMVRLIVIATIPTVLIGAVLERPVERLFASGQTLGVEFIITGLIIFLTESRGATAVQPDSGDGAVDRQHMTWRTAVIIGCAQGAAVFPALSRSGLTICAGIGSGLSRSTAVEFSFLLSIPVILGATVSQLAKSHAQIAALGPAAAWGVAASAIAGYAAIAGMRRLVKRRGLAGFGYYAVAIGLFVIGDQLFGHLVV